MISKFNSYDELLEAYHGELGFLHSYYSNTESAMFRFGGAASGVRRRYIFEHFCFAVKLAIKERGEEPEIGFHAANHLAGRYLKSYEEAMTMIVRHKKGLKRKQIKPRSTFSTGLMNRRFAKQGATAAQKKDAAGLAGELAATESFARHLDLVLHYMESLDSIRQKITQA